MGSEGLAFGRGIERESEGSAGRENSDWFTGGEVERESEGTAGRGKSDWFTGGEMVERESEGMAGRGKSDWFTGGEIVEREREGMAGRENSDWFTGGESDGLAGNILRGDSEEERVDWGMGDTDRMPRGPIGLCTILVSIERSLQFDVQWICGSFSTLRLLLCSDKYGC